MRKRKLILLTGLCLFLFLPNLLNPYWLRVLISSLFLSCLSYSHNLLFYFLGYPAFGGIAFFGFGAYIFSMLYANLSYPFFLSLFLGGLSSLLLSLSVSPIVMRLKSHYFAIATLALQLSFMELAENLDITGGTKGIVFKLTQQSNLISFYTFLAILLILLTFTVLL
ncbi:MAG: ABC transporter permease subunit, partial [Aquificaceae bacterium]